jgi:hypothetical protein
MLDNSQSNVLFTKHFRERIKERGIVLDLSEININRILSLPHYIDNGCYKYLDNKNQLVYYIRKNKTSLKLETIIKTNKIQMLRNLCDAHRMLCETKYHHHNVCKYCDKWNFNKICRDHIFGTCKRGFKCKFNHIDLPK